MRYFVVKNRQTNLVTAVVFQDTTALYYVVRSKSEAFRRAFEESAKYINGHKFIKSGNILKVNNVGLESYYWSKAVLDKACGSHWKVSLKKDMDPDEHMEDIISKILK